MTDRMKLTGGAALAALLLTATAPAARAADYSEPGCVISGSVMAGYLFDWQTLKFDGNDFDVDIDWSTPFGEGAGLVTCGGFNIQADVAYYAHSGDSEFSDVDDDQTNTHIGGALFYRDPVNWAAGIQTSWISQSIFGNDIDVFRVGLFGELYLNDVFTLGVQAAYHNSDIEFEGEDEDGFEIAAYGRFYATPDLSLMLRGDVLLANVETNERDGDLDGFAITGEAEYLVWDQGLSLFAGARYAERDLDVDNAFGDGSDFKFDTADTQVFGGIKFYFGQDGTLIDRQRSGTIDNTSVFEEKLPSILFNGRS